MCALSRDRLKATPAMHSFVLQFCLPSQYNITICVATKIVTDLSVIFVINQNNICAIERNRERDKNQKKIDLRPNILLCTTTTVKCIRVWCRTVFVQMSDDACMTSPLFWHHTCGTIHCIVKSTALNVCRVSVEFSRMSIVVSFIRSLSQCFLAHSNVDTTLNVCAREIYDTV